MAVAWHEFEGRVYEWWSIALRRFLDEHPDETYFGIAGLCYPYNPSFCLSIGCAEPVHTRLRAGEGTPPEKLREDPSLWAYRSIDLDRLNQDEFQKRFRTTLVEIYNALIEDPPESVHAHFEGLMEALMRALLRLEHEFVNGSTRFEKPADLFVHFEAEGLETSRARFRRLRDELRLEPGWSRQIESLQ